MSLRPEATVIMPVSAASTHGPAAVWITAAGWATALERSLGLVNVVSPDGVFNPDEALIHATAQPTRHDTARRRKRLPVPVSTLLSDGRAALSARRLNRFAMQHPLPQRLVWQQHNLFQTAGQEISRAADVPLVTFVDAPVAWEARRWGVKRRGWGTAIDRDEIRRLQRSTLIMTASSPIADYLVSRGVPASRTIVTPCAVDVDRFEASKPWNADSPSNHMRKIRIVWIGSFRRFHAVDRLIAAVSRLDRDSVELFLVGTGPEESNARQLAANAGIDVRFFGQVDANQVPGILKSCDVGVVTSRGGGTFHYSPLKLREYLASGLAVVVPSEPDIMETVTNGVDSLIYPPDSDEALSEALKLVVTDHLLRSQLQSEGLRLAREKLSWNYQVERMLEALHRIKAPSL